MLTQARNSTALCRTDLLHNNTWHNLVICKDLHHKVAAAEADKLVVAAWVVVVVMEDTNKYQLLKLL